MGILKAFLTSAMLKKLIISGLGFLGGLAVNHIAGINAGELQAATVAFGTLLGGVLAHALHLEEPENH